MIRDGYAHRALGERVAEDLVTQRLLAPIDCLEISPEIALDPALRSDYSEMVESSFSNHMQTMACLDANVPFAERLANPTQSYWLYRHNVPEPKPGHWKEVNRLALEAGDIASGKHMTVLACVALEQEAGHIRHSLDQLVHQSMLPQDYEVLLFLNTRGKDPASEQLTRQEIWRFQQTHPDIDMRSIQVQLTEDELLSDIKKKAADVAMTRWATAQYIDCDKYIVVLNDADSAYLHTEYLSDYPAVFDDDPAADIAVHVHDMDHRAFEALGPDFTFGARVRQAIERQMDRNSGLFFPEGFDIALRPQVYCGVGGFVPHRPFGVDYTFGKLLLHYRQDTHTVRTARPYEVGIQTSARRPAYSHLQGIISGTNTRDNEAINQALRTQGYPRLGLPDSLGASWENEIRRIQDHMEGLGIARHDPILSRLFRHFGVETVLERGHYIVTDATIFAEAYQRAFARGQT